MERRRSHAGGNLLIVLFLALVFGTGIHSLVSRDSRLGWGMFSRNMEFVIAYWWIDEQGLRVRYWPGEELRGKAVQLRPFTAAQVGKSSSRHTRYGTGTVKRWIGSYLQYVYETRRPENIVGIEARVYYSINEPLIIDEPTVIGGRFTFFDPQESEEATGRLLVLQYPAEGESP